MEINGFKRDFKLTFPTANRRRRCHRRRKFDPRLPGSGVLSSALAFRGLELDDEYSRSRANDRGGSNSELSIPSRTPMSRLLTQKSTTRLGSARSRYGGLRTSLHRNERRQLLVSFCGCVDAATAAAIRFPVCTLASRQSFQIRPCKGAERVQSD